MGTFDVRTLNSLAKVFMDLPLDETMTKSEGTMLKNEVYGFQFAFRFADMTGARGVEISAESDLGDALSIRFIDYVPCDFTMYPDDLEVTVHPQPGLFPDPLKKIDWQLFAQSDSWRAVWISIDGTKNEIKPGKHVITCKVQTGLEIDTTDFTLTVLDKKLPNQKLIQTNWFHCDSLCQYYHVDFNSDEFWRITENFARSAVEHGINMLLTPIFTPPLDTAYMGERLTIQLIDVEKNGDKYAFGFNKLYHWIEMCKRVGVEYYEISHLYTQWGCKYAPKIMATENGTYKKLFGWDTDAHGEEYKNFLSQLLPALTKELKNAGIADTCYFHVSDEPGIEMLEDYKSASDFIKPYLKDFHIFDALSSVEFYQTGAVPCPVPSIDHAQKFIDLGVQNLWAYFCCGQVTTANRFLAFESARHRILGMQLFKFDIVGFLQWGYNFYNTFLSIKPLDPYSNTTGGNWVPGGDTFIVYPGADGDVVSSIRFEVMREAMQDMRAMQALAAKIGKDAVVKLFEYDDLQLTNFKADANWLISVREKINELL